VARRVLVRGEPGIMGAGMRTLVLLPGLDGSEVMFRPLVASAPAGMVTRGLSYPKGARNSYEELLPLVQATLPREEPFYLLGWSFGGPLALMAAAACPANLRGVILAATFMSRPVPYLPGWARHLCRPALFRLYPAFARVKALLGGHATPALRALQAESHAQVNPETMACRSRAALGVDASQALAACRVPILYLQSSADRVIPASRARAIHRAHPALEVAEIEGPHLALATNPLAAWAAIRRFMDRVER
jgi:pimeloyl-[acyl-carrier protein] methyl ester esterase